MKRLTEKVVVVTGAAQGIGTACVRALVAEGASVVANDIDEERLGEFVSATGPGQHLRDYVPRHPCDAIHGGGGRRLNRQHHFGCPRRSVAAKSLQRHQRRHSIAHLVMGSRHA